MMTPSGSGVGGDAGVVFGLFVLGGQGRAVEEEEFGAVEADAVGSPGVDVGGFVFKFDIGG